MANLLNPLEKRKSNKMGIFILLAILLGIVLGTRLPIVIPLAYAKYISVSFLAALDSVLGAIRSGMEGKYKFSVFSTGFVTNALLAALLTLVGDRLGVDLYIAAVVVFGGRIFQNLAIIRRDLLEGKKVEHFSDEPAPHIEQD
jgi:small basic protein